MLQLLRNLYTITDPEFPLMVTVSLATPATLGPASDESSMVQQAHRDLRVPPLV